MANTNGALIISIKDIMHITGKTERTACRIFTQLKRKEGAMYLTIEAFCRHTGLKEDIVRKHLG